MRHGRKGRKLGRTASHKRATMNNMATSLFMHGRIQTTHAKAKELRGVAERLITFAKKGDLASRRQVLRRIRNKTVVSKLFDEIAPTYTERQGGYTRVLKVGPRRGDATEVAIIELVGTELRSEFADTSSAGASAPAPKAPAAPAAPAEEEVETEENVATAEAASDEKDDEDAATDDAAKEDGGEKKG